MKTKFTLSSIQLRMIRFILLYRCALDVIYCSYVSKIFGYTGFRYAFSFSRLLISWIILLFFIPAIVKLTERSRFSDVITLFLIYLAYIPYTTMAGFFPYSYFFITANTIYWMILLFFVQNLPSTQQNYLIMTGNNDLVLTIIEAVFVIVILYISWQYTGFRFTINLANVYTFREEAKNSSIPILLRYLFAASKAVNPILLAYSLDRKKIANAVLIIMIQILSFSINGSKMVLFSTLLAVGLFFFYSESQLKKLPQYLTALCVSAALERELFKSFFLISYVRRVLFLPNLLNSYYYDFFTKNTPDFFRQSFLRFLGVDSPYLDIDHMIGAIYFNKPEMGANNGLISDAITNMGYVGIVIMPIILPFFLRFLDSFSVGIKKRIYVSTAIMISFILISSFLSTALLTHGLLALGLVIAVIPREEETRLKDEYTNDCSQADPST